jgi:hypothetical protein
MVALPSHVTSFGYNNVGNNSLAINPEENAQPLQSLQQPQVTQLGNIPVYPQDPANPNSTPYPPHPARAAPFVNTAPISQASLPQQGIDYQVQLRIWKAEREAIGAERAICFAEKQAIQDLKATDPTGREIKRRQAELKAQNISLDRQSRELNEKQKKLNELKASESQGQQPNPKSKKKRSRESKALRDQEEKTGANCLPLPSANQMTGWKRVLEAQNRKDQERQAGPQENGLARGMYSSFPNIPYSIASDCLKY